MKTALRRRFAVVLPVAALFLASCAAPSAPKGAPLESALSPANKTFNLEAEGLRAAWRQELGQISDRPFESIYCTGRHVVVQAAEGEIHCIGAEKGDWKAARLFRRPLVYCPVEFGNTLFLVVGDVIYGFDVPSGKLTEGYDPKFALGTPPVVYDDSLILAGSKGDLARVNLADGSRPWQKSIMGAIFYPPVVSAGRLFAAGYRDQLISLDLEKGDKGKAPWWGWTPPAPSWLSSGLATLGDSIYVGDQRGFLYRLKAESGELTAKETLESPIVGEPSVVNGRLMVFTERPSMVCMGAEGAGMQQLWRYEGARKLLSVGKKVAYVLNDGPSVAAVRLEDGKELWRRALPKDCRVAGDPQRPAFYVANSAGSIVAFAELD